MFFWGFSLLQFCYLESYKKAISDGFMAHPHVIRGGEGEVGGEF